MFTHARDPHTLSHSLTEYKAVITMHNHQTSVKAEASLKRQDLKPQTLNQLLCILPTSSKVNGNDYTLSNGLEARDMEGLIPIIVEIHKMS